MAVQFPVANPPEGAGLLSVAGLDIVSAVATVAGNPAALGHTAVRLVRAAQQGAFLKQLGEEWDQLKADGHIKDDYGTTDQCRAGLADILESLGGSNFDQEQFDLIRKLFVAAASEQLTDRNSPLPREYLAIGRDLSAGGIELLAQTYAHVGEWRAKQSPFRPKDAASWLNLMQQRTGLKFQGLIAIHERKLIEKGLLFDRVNGDRSGIHTTEETYRLTDLGWAFCEFLGSYEKIGRA